MVHADDSFRTSLHVTPYDVPESSAPLYNERAYLPATEPAPNRNYDFAPVAHKPSEDAVASTPVEPIAKAVEPVKKPVAPKREKTEAALPGTKPPKVGVNIEWIQKGVGWDCREVYYVGKQRRRRHLGHIGRQKWEEMQQQFQGAELEQVLSEWIEMRRVEKSMSSAE